MRAPAHVTLMKAPPDTLVTGAVPLNFARCTCAPVPSTTTARSQRKEGI